MTETSSGAVQPGRSVMDDLMGHHDGLVRKLSSLDSSCGRAGLSDPEALASLGLPAGVGEYAAALAQTGALEAAVRGANPRSSSVEFASALRSMRSERCDSAAEAVASLQLAAALFEVYGCQSADIMLWVFTSLGEPTGSPNDLVPLRVMTQAELKKQAVYELAATPWLWWLRDNTRARRYYLAPGACPLDAEGRKTVLGIYRQREENRVMLFRVLGLLAAMLVFVWAFPEGAVFGHRLKWLGAVVFVVGVAVGVSCFVRMRRKPFNGFKGLVGALVVLWCLYAASVIALV